MQWLWILAIFIGGFLILTWHQNHVREQEQLQKSKDKEKNEQEKKKQRRKTKLRKLASAINEAQLQAEQQRVQEATMQSPASPEPPEMPPLVETDDNTFRKVIDKGTWVVMFYAPWCGHCTHLKPTFNEVAKEMYPTRASSTEETIYVARIDGAKNSTVNQQEGVEGYPTIIKYVNGERAEQYSGNRSLESILQFCRK